MCSHLLSPPPTQYFILKIHKTKIEILSPYWFFFFFKLHEKNYEQKWLSTPPPTFLKDINAKAFVVLYIYTTSNSELSLHIWITIFNHNDFFYLQSPHPETKIKWSSVGTCAARPDLWSLGSLHAFGWLLLLHSDNLIVVSLKKMHNFPHFPPANFCIAHCFVVGAAIADGALVKWVVKYGPGREFRNWKLGFKSTYSF